MLDIITISTLKKIDEKEKENLRKYKKRSADTHTHIAHIFDETAIGNLKIKEQKNLHTLTHTYAKCVWGLSWKSRANCDFVSISLKYILIESSVNI